MLFYEPLSRDPSLLPHDPFKALIAPRPIGWVTTQSRSGDVNLAPYSYFNAFADKPPIIAFSSAGYKDSVTFAEQTGEFVWNMATWDLRDAMNMTSAPLPQGESEADYAGLEMVPSRLVAPPRVTASPAALECKLIEIKRLHDRHGTALTIGWSSARSSACTSNRPSSRTASWTWPQWRRSPAAATRTMSWPTVPSS